MSGSLFPMKWRYWPVVGLHEPAGSPRCESAGGKPAVKPMKIPRLSPGGNAGGERDVVGTLAFGSGQRIEQRLEGDERLNPSHHGFRCGGGVRPGNPKSSTVPRDPRRNPVEFVRAGRLVDIHGPSMPLSSK